LGTPGTVLWAATGESVIRGMHVFGGALYVVAGASLYSIDAAGTISEALGTLGTSSGRVVMADNGTSSASSSDVGGNQLMIVDGAHGYIYDVTDEDFSTISGGGWPSVGAGTVAYIDGYFVIGDSGGMTARASNLYDGATWGTLAVSPVSAAPDRIQAAVNYHQQLWFVKEYTTEIWYDAGTATSAGFPFARMSGAVIDYGTPAPHSVARGANSLFFLANQRAGDGGNLVGVVRWRIHAEERDAARHRLSHEHLRHAVECLWILLLRRGTQLLRAYIPVGQRHVGLRRDHAALARAVNLDGRAPRHGPPRLELLRALQ
jgi:hypothetical protein